MLKIKFSKLKNIVIMEILEQSEKDTQNLVEEEEFIASNRFIITTDEYPEILDKDQIYVKGKRDNRLACYSFNNEKEADMFINNACFAVREYNNFYNPKSLNDANTSMTFSTFIAE